MTGAWLVCGVYRRGCRRCNRTCRWRCASRVKNSSGDRTPSQTSTCWCTSEQPGITISPSLHATRNAFTAGGAAAAGVSQSCRWGVASSYNWSKKWSKNFFRKSSSPSCHPSRRGLDSSDLDSHQIYGSLGPPKSASQTASRSVQPFLHGSRTWQQTHRQITLLRV